MDASSPLFHTVLDTVLGPIGLAWRAEANRAPVVRLQLPAGDAADTEKAFGSKEEIGCVMPPL